MLDWEEIQASGHDQLAQYATDHGRQRMEVTKHILRRILPKNGGGRYLDLGCGMGLYSVWIAEWTGGDVLGIDIADYGLDRAVTHDRVEYLHADANDFLPDTFGCFNLALAAQVFEYVNDPRDAMDNFDVSTWVITVPATVSHAEEALTGTRAFTEESTRALLDEIDHYERDQHYFYIVGR